MALFSAFCLVLLQALILDVLFVPLLKSNHQTKLIYMYWDVTWPGELDLAPDAMHTEIKKNGCWVLE